MRFIKYGILVLAFVMFGRAWADAATPAVATLAASSVGPVATLGGSVNPGGADTAAWFEWGMVANYYTNVTTPMPVGSGSASVNVSNLLSGLTPGFVYHYRVVASNAFGLARGGDVPFGSPAIVLNGSSVVTNELHSGFVDLGATATGGILDIEAGFGHSMALKSDRTIAAWGDNQYGNTDIPAGLSNVMAISASYDHSLALRSNGMVAAWGLNIHGQTTVPDGLSNVVAIAAGGDHSLVLKDDGTVVVWGAESSPDGVALTNIPAGLGQVEAIDAGRDYNLVLKSDGTIAAWGDNDEGETNIPAGLSNVVAISAGGFHGLALRSDGTVVGWGDNASGQATIPAGLTNVVAIAGGDQHSMILKSDGTVVAWGDNFFGQTNVPAGLSNVVAIAAGFGHSLALKSDGTVVGWGAKIFIEYGQIDTPVGLTNLSVTVSGGVDTNTPGSYLLTYASSNSIGGFATTTRTVVVQSPINPPVLGGFTTVSNGMFQFGFTNVSGTSFTVLASTNVTLPLNLWSNLGAAVEMPANSGQYQFTDLQATNLVQRYYRVRSP